MVVFVVYCCVWGLLLVLGFIVVFRVYCCVWSLLLCLGFIVVFGVYCCFFVEGENVFLKDEILC